MQTLLTPGEIETRALKLCTLRNIDPHTTVKRQVAGGFSSVETVTQLQLAVEELTRLNQALYTLNNG